MILLVRCLCSDLNRKSAILIGVTRRGPGAGGDLDHVGELLPLSIIPSS